MSLSVYVTGLLTGLSLIVAIGAQNAFVLRQGLMGEHVFAVAFACSLSDAALIALGVTSFRQIAVMAPWFLPAMRYGGAAFLIWYGARNLYPPCARPKRSWPETRVPQALHRLCRCASR